MDKKVGFCSAVAISGNRIVALGSDDTIGTLLSSRGQKIDLEGRCVVPGLVDAHLHFQYYALSLQQLDLSDVPTLAEAVAMVKEEALIGDGNVGHGQLERADRQLLSKGKASAAHL